MARTLTTPIERADGTQQAVAEIFIAVPHKRNDTDDAHVIDKDNVFIRYEVLTLSTTGEILERNKRQVPFSEWPAAFVTDMQAVYAKIYTDAESVGLVAGVGTDESLE